MACSPFDIARKYKKIIYAYTGEVFGCKYLGVLGPDTWVLVNEEAWT